MDGIKIENATFRYRSQHFYDNFNLSIQKGEHWVITGAIGAGKSILAAALSGNYYVSKGSIHLPSFKKKGDSFKQKVVSLVEFKDDSRVFNPNLYFYQQRFNAFVADGTMTVWEYLINIGFDERIKEHVDLIKETGVFPLLDLERIKLSSGQSRKLLITKAILQKPKFLIIDNPYLGLDAASRTSFNELLDKLASKQLVQLILIGQYKTLPKCISHRLHLENFKVAYSGPLTNCHVGIEKMPISYKQEVIKELQSIYQNPSFNLDIIFELKNTSVVYYEKKVVKQVNWQVKAGEKWALMGANGSGKSTILALLFGDHPQAYSNDIYLFGQKRGVGQNIWDIKKNTGYTSPELHYFFSYKMTCRDTIISGLFDHVYLKRPPTEKENRLITLFLDYFEIKHLSSRLFQSLSTGEQRVVLLIRALIKNPPLLLLDEPFQGFDKPTIHKAKHLLNQLLGPKHTLVFISHYEEQIPEMVSKRAYLKEGILELIQKE